MSFTWALKNFKKKVIMNVSLNSPIKLHLKRKEKKCPYNNLLFICLSNKIFQTNLFHSNIPHVLPNSLFAEWTDLLQTYLSQIDKTFQTWTIFIGEVTFTWSPLGLHLQEFEGYIHIKRPITQLVEFKNNNNKGMEAWFDNDGKGSWILRGHIQIV